MGSRRVSSYRSRVMRRTAGSESKKRSGSRTAVTGLHRGRPARGVLPLPRFHRCFIARDAARRGVDTQDAAGRLRDVAEVAQQHALRALLDRLPQRAPGADRIHEVVDVQSRHLVVGGDVEAVCRPRREGRLHHLLLEVVHRVTVAVEHHAAGGAQDGRAARPSERGQAVAALPLPDDGFPVRELEPGLLRIGELPVIGVVIATADGRHARGVAHAQRPAGHVDLVRAVVEDLARSPAPEPMPIVMNDVVAVRRTRRRYLRCASTNSSPSRGLCPHGFSTYTCFPACSASNAAGVCQWSGAAITRASTSLSSSALRKSPTALGDLLCTPATVAPPLASTTESTSHTYATSAWAARAKPRASTVPRPFMPMTATLTCSPGERSQEENRGEPARPIPAAEAVFRNLRRFIDHAP